MRKVLVIDNGSNRRDALALAWAALNLAVSYRDALLLLAEDMLTEPETVAAAQRYISKMSRGAK